jgi:hypothetical protein
MLVAPFLIVNDEKEPNLGQFCIMRAKKAAKEGVANKVL